MSEAGLPLGLLRLSFDPQPRPGRQRMRKRWLHAFRDITDTFQEVGGKTRAIIVCDEETEMFELFNAQRQQKRFELLVRANQHQNLTSPDREENNSRKKLFA